MGGNIEETRLTMNGELLRLDLLYLGLSFCIYSKVTKIEVFKKMTLSNNQDLPILGSSCKINKLIDVPKILISNHNSKLYYIF